MKRNGKSPRGRAMKGEANLINRAVQRAVVRQFELKRFALISTANANATAGSVVNLTNGIIQGDDIVQRSGDQIRIRTHKLTVRASAVAASQTFRFIWFRDNMNRGTTPTVLELLNTASFMSQYNPVSLQQKRFTIIRDVTLDCSLAGEAIKSKSLTSPGTLVNYNGATAVAASNGPGAIFLLEIGDAITGLYDLSYEPVYTDA